MPVAFRLYLPEAWANDSERRQRVGVPAEVRFRTKPEIALEQVRRARKRGIPEGVVLVDAGYGNDTGFRTQLTKMELRYVAGIMSTVSVWKPGQGPKAARLTKGPAGHRGCYRQMESIHRFPSNSWRDRCRWRPGKM